MSKVRDYSNLPNFVSQSFDPSTGYGVVVLRDMETNEEFEHVISGPGRPPLYNPARERKPVAARRSRRDDEDGDGGSTVGTSFSLISPMAPEKGMSALFVPVSEFQNAKKALRNTQLVEVERVFKNKARVRAGDETISVPLENLWPVAS